MKTKPLKMIKELAEFTLANKCYGQFLHTLTIAKDKLYALWQDSNLRPSVVYASLYHVVRISFDTVAVILGTYRWSIFDSTVYILFEDL